MHIFFIQTKAIVVLRELRLICVAGDIAVFFMMSILVNMVSYPLIDVWCYY